MICKKAETKPLDAQDITIDGIRLNVWLESSANDVTLADNDFLPQQVTIKVELNRDTNNVVLLQDNLMVLGLYSDLNYGPQNWYRGNVIRYDDAGHTMLKLYSLYIPFGGPVNLKGTDKITTQVYVGQNAFGATANQNTSYVEFNWNRAIGYEIGTPQIISKVVQANITQEDYAFGDNVTKVAFLQFDKDNILDQVINNVTLQCDKLQQNFNFYDTLNNHWSIMVPPAIQYRYGNAQTAAGLTAEAFPFLPRYPQSVVLFASDKAANTSLNNVVVAASYGSGTQVNASQNYWVATRFLVTRASVDRAQRMANKHTNENIAQLK